MYIYVYICIYICIYMYIYVLAAVPGFARVFYYLGYIILLRPITITDNIFSYPAFWETQEDMSLSVPERKWGKIDKINKLAQNDCHIRVQRIEVPQ